MNKYDSKSKQQVFINDRIRCRNSRVVDDGNGNQLGIMPTINAIEMAKSKNLDLMQIGFLSRTPRGRCVTRSAYEHLGIPYKKKDPLEGGSQIPLE